MGISRTAWHLPFATLIAERGPPGLEIHPEALLTREPQRADLILRRRASALRGVHRARVLRRLWRRLRGDTIVEFKSAARPFRRGDLLRLWGYGTQYHAKNARRLRPAELTLVLVVHALTRPLLQEIAWMSWRLSKVESGYHRIEGAVYSIYVVAIDEVAEAEADPYLALFGKRIATSREARTWLSELLAEERGKRMIQDQRGYINLLAKLVDDLPPAERVKGLTPTQRMRGLTPEEVLGGLPVEVLRGLSKEYLNTLPAQVRASIRKRLHR